MDQLSITTSMQIGRRDVFWLSLALLFHAPLFLIPLSTPESAQKTSRVVSVMLAPRQSAKTEEAERADPVSHPVPYKAEPSRDVPSEESRPLPAIGTEAAVAPESSPGITAAALIDFARTFRWRLPEVSEKHQLGDRPAPRATENGQSAFRTERGWLDRAFLPEKTEVVDRWLAADGSQNVVINTPSGQTLCGRAPAWDPLNPLIEHVMQFRTCGGGGERAFKMPDRFIRHLVD